MRLACAALMGFGLAKASLGADLPDALAGSTPLLDIRLRHEAVDQQPFAQDAQATTLRARFGVQTGAAWKTTFIAEGVANAVLQEDFNSTTNGRVAYPVVADPRNVALNRLQFVNTALPGTTLTIGRQRLNLDDQRFVGSVAWRQNEQTFDAARAVIKPARAVTLDVTYANQVNRVFGRDGAPGANDGRFHGNNWLANASWQTKIGKLSGFGYFVDLEETPFAIRESTRTLGVRLAGSRPGGPWTLGYVFSYATQRDHGDNPLAFRNRYGLGELSMSWHGVSLGAGREALSGNGIKGFSAPLGTLHKFQGWADKFLTTPPDGLRDDYASAGWQVKALGPLDVLALSVIWHRFEAERTPLDYGNELDVQLQATHRRVSGLLKYAEYTAAAYTPPTHRDTRKLWAQVEFAW